MELGVHLRQPLQMFCVEQPLEFIDLLLQTLELARLWLMAARRAA